MLFFEDRTLFFCDKKLTNSCVFFWPLTQSRNCCPKHAVSGAVCLFLFDIIKCYETGFLQADLTDSELLDNTVMLRVTEDGFSGPGRVMDGVIMITIFMIEYFRPNGYYCGGREHRIS